MPIRFMLLLLPRLSSLTPVQVPKVTFMDLFVYPTSTLAISKRGKNDVTITALDTEIHGSHHVESLDCNNRFELLLDVRLAAVADTYATTHFCRATSFAKCNECCLD
jgi:hypothetical protein